MIRRSAMVLVACMVFALTSQVKPRGETATEQRPGAVSLTTSQGGSQWFCPAGSVLSPSSVRHTLSLLNTSGDATTARVEGFVNRGGVAISKSIDIAAQSLVEVNTTELNAEAVSFAVTFSGSGGSVAHRLDSSHGYTEAACMSMAASTWFFGHVSTAERTTSARLHILNPFPTPATVDVLVPTQDTLKTPGQLEGLRIPGRSAVVVELGDSVPLYPEFGVQLVTRSGLIAAEIAQGTSATSGPTGASLITGQPSARSRWLLPQSYAGEGVTEDLTLLNPSKEDVDAVVQVYPAESGESPPDPFVVSVPGRRIVTLRLAGKASGTNEASIESARLPASGIRWILVDASNPIVVGRSVSLSGSSSERDVLGRPSVSRGHETSAAVPVLATGLTFTALSNGSGAESLFIANPGDSIALVSLVQIGAGAQTIVVDQQEVAPHAVLGFELGFLTDDAVGLRIDSTAPVAAEVRLSSTRVDDLSAVQPAPSADLTSDIPGIR